MILNKIQFTNLRVLYWLIPLLILMLYLLKKKFVKDELRLIKTKNIVRIKIHNFGKFNVCSKFSLLWRDSKFNKF